MRNSVPFRSFATLACLAAVGLIVAGTAQATSPPWPQTPLSGKQLVASSQAATKYGVPVNIVRGVTTYKNGGGSTTGDFNGEAQRLAWWYKHLYPRYGGAALVNWLRATAAEMGPTASQQDIAAASANQHVALGTILTAPFWATVATLLPGAASVGAAAPGEIGLSGAPSTAPVAAGSGGGAAAAGAGAGGSGAGKLGTALGGGSAADGTPASALSTAPMAALAGGAAIFVADHISADTKANLTSGWFQPLYQGIENYAWLLAVVAICAAVMHIMITAKAGELAMVVGRVPFAALLMVGVPVVAMAAMAITDQTSADLLRAFPDGTKMLHIMAGILGVLGSVSVLASLLGHATIAHFTGTGAWLIGAFGLLSAGAIALELIAREVAIYLTVLVVPLALAGEIFSPFAGWAKALIKVLFVVIISKLFLAMGLVVAGTLMFTGVTAVSPIMAVVGLVALILIALFPALIYGALIRIESTWHSGLAHTAMGAPQTTMANHVRSAHNRVQTAVSSRSSNGSTPPTPPAAPPTTGRGGPSGPGAGPSSNGNNGGQPPNQRPPSPPKPPPPAHDEPPRTPVPEPA